MGGGAAGMKRRIYLLDTNVLLHDPEAVLQFDRQQVVIAVTVLEELDRYKRYRDELGRNARAAIRLLDSLKWRGSGNLHEGVELENGSLVRIQLDLKSDESLGLSPAIPENKIIMTAHILQKKGERVIFVSKDFGARVRAEAMGLEAQDYLNLKVSFDEMPKGIREVQVDKGLVDLFLKNGKIPLSELSFKRELANEYVKLFASESSFAVGRTDPQGEDLLSLGEPPRDVWGLKPLNFEQSCAIDLLLREEVNLVSLVGVAGTGKTLLALAAGLRKVFDETSHSRLVVSRPIMPLGKDIGYLPGTKEEKLTHWMAPIYDNLEFLCESAGKKGNDTLRWIVDSKKMELEAVTYIRGRSLPRVYMIIDEAQNLTPHELKTVISRAGHGTKVILTGDPTQIDNPYLDKDSNGLTVTIGRLREYGIFGHVLLERTERSRLAAVAAEVL